MERYEKRGFWWLPDNPERQVPGTLVFGHGTDSELQLLGSTRDDEAALEQMMRWGTEYRPEIILGRTSDGKEYTLFDCLQTGGSLSALMMETFHPAIILEGRHFLTANEIVFQHLAMRLSHLGEWLQRTGREITIDDPESDQRKYTLTYQKPNTLIFSYGSGRAEFGHDSNMKFARFRGDFVISEEACVVVFPEQPLAIRDFLREHLPIITHFISLGVGRTLSILELRGKVALDCDGKTAEEIIKAPTVHLYWKKPPRADEDKELFFHDMVATCPDFGDGLGDFLKAWNRAYGEIKPVMQLFFGTVLPEDSVSVNSFINAVQAVEAYHRFRRDGNELPISDHAMRLNSILSSVGDDYREWLSQKLQYSNEKGLRRRLKEMLRERQDLFNLSGEEIKRLANRTTELRNFFTHYDGDRESEFGTGLEFYVFGQLFKWVMIACLLEETGFARDRAHALISRNQSFLYFKTVHLKGQQVDVVKVETVRKEEVPKLDVD